MEDISKDPKFKELVKEATKEVIREEIKKQQSTQTKYLQEGNMHLNE